jgi:hypothetical protein
MRGGRETQGRVIKAEGIVKLQIYWGHLYLFIISIVIVIVIVIQNFPISIPNFI